MIALVDVTGNNLSSLTNALQRLGHEFVLTHCAEDLQRASHVILPGVGAAAPAMRALREHQLVEVLQTLAQPLLGICLGMQLLYEYSEEGNVDCLGIIPGKVSRLRGSDAYPVPHMGWNRLLWDKPEYVYFVHSYAAAPGEYTLASCEYGETFTAVVQKGRVIGMQFHPEKSAKAGMALLDGFCSS